MNHLREVVEQLSNDNVLIPNQWTNEDGLGVAKYFTYYAESAMCFYAGDPYGFDGIKSLVDSSVTPNDVCWYECDFVHTDGHHVIFGILTVHTQGKYSHILIRRKQGQWMIRHNVAQMADGRLSVSPAECADEAVNMVTLRNVIVSSMRCSNIQTVDNKPDARLQKKRAKEGRLPLFSYWTLHINERSKRTDDSQNESDIVGINRGSPRLHMRRGHIREYKTGSYTWVQACLVGNGERGYIHKDYDLTASCADAISKSGAQA